MLTVYTQQAVLQWATNSCHGNQDLLPHLISTAVGCIVLPSMQLSWPTQEVGLDSFPAVCTPATNRGLTKQLLQLGIQSATKQAIDS